MKQKLIIAFILISAAAAALTAGVRLSIHVNPDMLSRADAYADPVIQDEVFISKKYIHFSEDYHLDKAVRSYIDRCSFSSFVFKKGKLTRDLFFIINPEGVDEDGFYRIQCSIVKKEVRSTIRIFDVRITRLQKLPTRIAVIRSEFVKKLSTVSDELGTADLAPIYAADPRAVKVSALSSRIRTVLSEKGADSLEYLGGGAGRHLFRFMIGNADSEAQKRERSAARGYFCYLDYDVTRSRIDAYYTLVDYSVYIK
jgi:hypothetical protein